MKGDAVFDVPWLVIGNSDFNNLKNICDAKDGNEEQVKNKKVKQLEANIAEIEAQKEVSSPNTLIGLKERIKEFRKKIANVENTETLNNLIDNFWSNISCLQFKKANNFDKFRLNVELMLLDEGKSAIALKGLKIVLDEKKGVGKYLLDVSTNGCKFNEKDKKKIKEFDSQKFTFCVESAEDIGGLKDRTTQLMNNFPVRFSLSADTYTKTIVKVYFKRLSKEQVKSALEKIKGVFEEKKRRCSLDINLNKCDVESILAVDDKCFGGQEDRTFYASRVRIAAYKNFPEDEDRMDGFLCEAYLPVLEILERPSPRFRYTKPWMEKIKAEWKRQEEGAEEAKNKAIERSPSEEEAEDVCLELGDIKLVYTPENTPVKNILWSKNPSGSSSPIPIPPPTIPFFQR